MNFDLYLPVEVIFGVGSVNKVGEVGRRFGYRVLIATGKKSTKENGALDRVVESLNRNGAEEIIIFDQIEPNPTDKSVNLASEIVVKEKIDYIIGLGGRSSLDSTKAISIVSSNEGYAWDYVNYPEGPRLIPFLNRPVICIPTTAGTGSEVNRYSVLSNPIRKEKMVISHSLNYPRVAIIDPSLTVSMDRRLTALTGIDALMHALESLTNRLSNFFAEAYIGSYFEMEQVGTSLFIAYTYKFQWLNFYFGLKPLFIFLYKEEKDGRDAFARGNKGEDSSKGLQ